MSQPQRNIAEQWVGRVFPPFAIGNTLNIGRQQHKTPETEATSDTRARTTAGMGNLEASRCRAAAFGRRGAIGRADRGVRGRSRASVKRSSEWGRRHTDRAVQSRAKSVPFRQARAPCEAPCQTRRQPSGSGPRWHCAHRNIVRQLGGVNLSPSARPPIGPSARRIRVSLTLADISSRPPGSPGQNHCAVRISHRNRCPRRAMQSGEQRVVPPPCVSSWQAPGNFRAGKIATTSGIGVPGPSLQPPNPTGQAAVRMPWGQFGEARLGAREAAKPAWHDCCARCLSLTRRARGSIPMSLQFWERSESKGRKVEMHAPDPFSARIPCTHVSAGFSIQHAATSLPKRRKKTSEGRPDTTTARLCRPGRCKPSRSATQSIVH